MRQKAEAFLCPRAPTPAHKHRAAALLITLPNPIMQSRPGLWSAVLQAEESGDNLEQFKDADEGGEAGFQPTRPHTVRKEDSGAAPRWPDKEGGYDAQKR